MVATSPFGTALPLQDALMEESLLKVIWFLLPSWSPQKAANGPPCPLVANFDEVPFGCDKDCRGNVLICHQRTTSYFQVLRASELQYARLHGSYSGKSSPVPDLPPYVGSLRARAPF